MRTLFGLLGVFALVGLPLLGCGDSSDGDAPECQSADDCNDGNECTEDVCDAAGGCSNTPLEDGAICGAGACTSSECDPITSIFDCSEQGIRDAIAEGGGPHAFDCADLTTVTTTAGQIIIDNDVILDGLDVLQVEAGSALERRVFLIEEGANAELRRFAVTGGDATGQGGGIWNLGSATLVRCRVSNNSSASFGGGISSGDTLRRLEADLTVIDSIVSGNEASTGGGILSYGTLRVLNTTVSGNSAFTVGGIGSSGMGTVSNSAVTGNDAQLGGGIWNESGILTLMNSTVSGNSANAGGGIFNSAGSMTVTNSTLANNSAAQEGSAIADWPQEGAAVTLTGSLVGGSCSAVVLSNGYNVESPADTCGFEQTGDQVNVSAEQLNLQALANNGGPTQTHALGSGSVAINRIPAEMCELEEDQRGVARPQGSACDVGAFELVQP